MTRSNSPALAWIAALKPGFGLLVPLLVVVVGLAGYIVNPLPLQAAQHLVFDQFQRWHPRAEVVDPVRIIDIDDESLQRLGQWPWPRTRMAELTGKLQQAGVTAIGFDMVFSEPDRTSPLAMVEAWNPPPDVRQMMATLPDHDQVLADALKRGKAVLGFALNRQPHIQPTKLLDHSAASAQSKAQFVALNAPALPFVPAFISSVLNLPSLEAAAEGNGALSFVPDADGVVRRVPMLVRQGGALLPGLVPEVLRVAQGARTITTRAADGAGIESIRVGAATVATTATGEVWVHYAQPSPARYLSAWKVLAGGLSQGELQGKMVLVGASAQGLMDMRFSALGTVLPGVEIHAQVLDQIAGGGGVNRPSWSSALEVLTLVAGGLLAGWVAIRLGALRAVAVATVMLVSVCGIAWLAFLQWGVLLDPVMPASTLGTAFVLSSIIHHVRVEHRQRWVRQAFSRYVSPNLVNYLVAHPETLRLSGQRQHCSFLFTDLEGFTHTLERMDPGAAVSMVNGYLDGMIAIAFAHQGTLTRIVGDGLAIVFSAPVAQPDHPLRAVTCALEMQHFTQQYARKLKSQRGIAFGYTRMGVHTGEVIVGNFGGANLFDYRALGDPVNTAARLEGANRYLGTSICMSQAVALACPGIASRPIGQLLLLGKSVPVTVFEPLAIGEQVDAPYLAAYMLLQDSAHDTGQVQVALRAFEALAASRPNDRLVGMHLTRLKAGERGDRMVLAGK